MILSFHLDWDARNWPFWFNNKIFFQGGIFNLFSPQLLNKEDKITIWISIYEYSEVAIE